MPCYFKNSPESRMVVCGKLGPHCRQTGCGWVSGFQCDYPVGKGKTCDRYLCDSHAYAVGPDTHYCEAHHRQWTAFQNSGGVTTELNNVALFGAVRSDEEYRHECECRYWFRVTGGVQSEVADLVARIGARRGKQAAERLREGMRAEYRKQSAR